MASQVCVWVHCVEHKEISQMGLALYKRDGHACMPATVMRLSVHSTDRLTSVHDAAGCAYRAPRRCAACPTMPRSAHFAEQPSRACFVSLLPSSGEEIMEYYTYDYASLRSCQ